MVRRADRGEFARIGMTSDLLLSEIYEQPAALERFLAAEGENAIRLAREIARRGARRMTLLAMPSICSGPAIACRWRGRRRRCAHSPPRRREWRAHW